jgi:hypothetical protein
MKTLLPAAAAAALAALAAAPARADVVELNNGRSLEGEVLSETDTSVTLRVDGGQVTFPKSLVSSIRREPKPDPAKTDPPKPAPAPAAGAPAPGAPAAEPKPPEKPEPAGLVPAKDDWLLLWSPERRAGWRHSQAKLDPSGAGMFEEETTWLGPGGKPQGTVRLVEESGAGFTPLSFLLVSEMPGKSYSRAGHVAGGRLSVETWQDGQMTTRDLPVPRGLRFALAARALVLAESGREGAAWNGPIYDPAAADFGTLAFRVARRESVSREGAPVDTVVLAREEGGRAREERVAADGRLLDADLDGAGLSAVGTTKARVEAFRAGTAEDEASETEKRGRMALACPEDGFRIRKPGVSWTLVPAASREARERAGVKDLTGAVTVTVASDPAPAGPEPDPAELGAALEVRLKEADPDCLKIEAGPAALGGSPGWRLLVDTVVNGDKVRLAATTLARAGRVWTVTAVAPRATWTEARPYLQRILESIEWF